MAIVKMNKFTLLAFEKDKEELLKRLQEFEGVQFVDLKPQLENEELSFLKTLASDKKHWTYKKKSQKLNFV